MAAPITISNGPYTYTNNTLFITASGNNQHRRATLPELHDLFNTSTTTKDPPAHWLWDAVRAGGLQVPGHVREVEGKMEREWKAEVRKQGKAETGGARAKGKGKRKADDGIDVAVSGGGGININVSVNVGGGKAPATKKVKTASDSKADRAERKQPAAKKTAAKSNTASTASSRITEPQYARRGQGGFSNVVSSSGRAVTSTQASSPPPAQPRKKQTARRSRPFPYPSRPVAPARDSPPHPNINLGSPSDPPPPYRSSPEFSDDGNNVYDGNLSPTPPCTGHLGLLNGRYELESPALYHWFISHGRPFHLILTLDGTALWGAFDLGITSGIFYIPQRPWEPSAEREYEFRWRGRECGDGDVMFDDARQKGCIRFVGDGMIRGAIDVFGDVAQFKGVRVSGEQTRSERDARSMRAEWEWYGAGQ
ncbi:hypothetical protein AJ79_00248 [Helicocarpus griseus UAMH5409]|uniref:Uncharacterized protein n=1 Tax=Helicocarpus griseus UAMH5409 TaxID=1447875 RepID=A0A2B7YC37_9EURO|nr:hypothetical protein AJ79_00248 [Helicocarpus griseus UAMH5409]